MNQSLYLYGFVPAGSPPPPADLRGVAGAPVEILDLGAVGAAVSRVPEDHYGEAAVAERLHDLSWVGEQGALHERVVTWFVDQGGILPVRLLTLYSGEATLRASLAGEDEAIGRRLRRLAGLREWDLKVSYDDARLREHLGAFSAEVAALDEEMARAAPGRRYLLERKREQRVQSEMGRAARGIAEELLGALATFATRTERLPLPRERQDLPVVLNAALLVPREREAAAMEHAGGEARRLGELGVEVHFTGPWAPYRFLGGEDRGRVEVDVGEP